jgi:hypothetical protein
MLRILAHAMYQLLQNTLTKFSCITRIYIYMDHVIIGDFLVFIRYVIVNTVTLYPSLGNCQETDPATLVKGGRQKLQGPDSGHNSCQLVHPETGRRGAYQTGSNQQKAFMLFTL